MVESALHASIRWPAIMPFPASVPWCSKVRWEPFRHARSFPAGTGTAAVSPDGRMAPRMGNARRMSLVDFEFEGPVVEWRGLPPFYFLRIPDESADIEFAAREIEYWGQVPVAVRISDTEFTTALFPRPAAISSR